jgi:hypothetical protein
MSTIIQREGKGLLLQSDGSGTQRLLFIGADIAQERQRQMQIPRRCWLTGFYGKMPGAPIRNLVANGLG